MFELLAVAALSTSTQEVECPLRIEHPVAFTSEQATDLFVAELTGPCTFDEARVTMTLYGQDGEILHAFPVESDCAITLSDLEGDVRGAKAQYAPLRAEDMTAPEALSDYEWTQDVVLYTRARETGGPLVCANTMPFGGECIWFDPTVGRAVTVMYYGS